MRKWPKDDAPASIDDLAQPICKAIRAAYDLSRKNPELDVPWTGPIDHDGGYSATKILKAENLRYSLEDQNRNALEEIIGVAIRLGIEQGRRIEITRLRREMAIHLMIELIENTRNQTPKSDIEFSKYFMEKYL